MYKKVECSLFVFFALGWFLGCQVLIFNLFKLFWKNSGSPFELMYHNHLFKINILIQIVCMAGFFIWHRRSKQNPFDAYKGFKIKRLMLYIFYGIALWLLSAIINALLSPFFSDYASKIQMLFTERERIFRFLVLVITAPLVEEYLFRGVIQNKLKEGFSVKTAIILQGILFGIIHPIGLQKIYGIFLGIVLGIIKEQEKNLQSSTTVHMTVNLISVLTAMLL